MPARDQPLTIVARIAELAERYSETISVIDDQAHISWRELQQRSDQMRDALACTGIDCGNTIAILLPRSIDSVIASLAVLKLGAACMPLSLSDSPEIQRFRLADCAVETLIVRSRPEAIAYAATVRSIVTIADLYSVHGAPRVSSEANPEATAWITPAQSAPGISCNTELTHANLAFLCDWLQEKHVVRSGDRACHRADPATSAALLEVWPPLACGATVVIMDDCAAADTKRTPAWIEDQRISLFMAGADVLPGLNRPRPRTNSSLRLLVADMDVLETAPARHGYRVMLTFGTDECSMVSTARMLGPNERQPGRYIGLPVPGASLHILNDGGEPVLPGEEGQLWIGGRGVARGYRNRPGLTAERFVPNPFDDDPAGMMFDTGERARELIGGGYVRFTDRRKAVRP